MREQLGSNGVSLSCLKQEYEPIILTRTVVGDRARMPQIAEYYQEIYGIKPHLKRLGSKSDLFKKMTALQKQYPDEPFKYMAMYVHQFSFKVSY